MPTIQFSGLASGIDSSALIDAIIKARETTNELRRAEIDHLNSENDALEELNTKILALNDLIDKFRTVNGGGVNKKSSSSDTTVATAAVGSEAVISSFSVTVNSIASTAQASFNDVYASTTSALAPNAVGTQNIQVDAGTGSNLVSVLVPITSSTTVQEFVDAFNADSDAAGRIVASLVNVGTTASPSYRVAFNTLQGGTDLGTIAFTIPSGAAGFGGNTDLQNRTVNQATDANFNVSGIASAITRSTNSVSDVLTGITLNLSKAGTATITVSNDSDGTADDVQAIIEAFNDVVEYVNENDLVTRVESGSKVTNEFGTLAKTRVDNDFLSEFRLSVASADSDNASSVFAFSDLGIATNRDGTIAFDRDEFIEALGEDPTGAAEVLIDFADSLGGVDGVLYQYTKFQGYIDIAQQSNDAQVETLNNSIDQLDRQNTSYRKTLEGTFARLESLTARLQGQQNALSSAISSLGR